MIRLPQMFNDDRGDYLCLFLKYSSANLLYLDVFAASIYLAFLTIFLIFFNDL